MNFRWESVISVMVPCGGRYTYVNTSMTWVDISKKRPSHCKNKNKLLSNALVKTTQLRDSTVSKCSETNDLSLVIRALTDGYKSASVYSSVRVLRGRSECSERSNYWQKVLNIGSTRIGSKTYVLFSASRC